MTSNTQLSLLDDLITDASATVGGHVPVKKDSPALFEAFISAYLDYSQLRRMSTITHDELLDVYKDYLMYPYFYMHLGVCEPVLDDMTGGC